MTKQKNIQHLLELKIPYITNNSQKKTILHTKLKQLNINMSLDLHQTDDFILNYIFSKLNDNREDLYNFIIILKYANIDCSTLEKINNIESKIYSAYDAMFIQYVLYENTKKILENIINEMISKDIDIQTSDDLWVTINLDQLYNIKLEHIVLTDENIKKILPRTKDLNISKKIINNNLILTTLFRNENIFLYSKQKKTNTNPIIEESIKFTKGYKVCIAPSFVKKLKKLLYCKKLYLNKPLVINEKNINTTLEGFDNKNYSANIWLPFDNIIDYKEKHTIDLLKNPFPSKKILNVINHLNSTKLSFDKKTFKTIYNMANQKNSLGWFHITKNKIINNMYDIGRIENNTIIIDDEIDEVDFDLQKAINSAASLELIKNQYNRISKYDNAIFYLNHRLDSRYRVYVYNVPLNYQLSHVARATILIKQKIKINKTFKKFFNLKLVNENLYSEKLFTYQQINLETIFKVIDERNLAINKKIKTIEDSLKIECLIMVLSSLSPKKIKNIEEKLTFAENFLDIFLKENIETHWEKWKHILEISNKKIFTIISLQTSLKKIIYNDDYTHTFWCDASSNALQLITLRLENFNEKLLMLTNIIENKTKYVGIYSYITEMIKNTNHAKIIKTLNNKLDVTEINNLINDEDTKKRAMPASYGKTLYSNRIDTDNILNADNRSRTWNKLNDNEKKATADYFWDLTFKYLKEIGYDIEEYKQICKLEKKDIYYWYNDYDLPVIPVTFKKSKRQIYLKEINKLEYINSITYDLNKKSDIVAKIEKYKTKIKIDEKLFWKRTKITLKDEKITIRLPNTQYMLDKRKITNAVVPNSIHSYDSSIIFLITEVCKTLKINILVIHDSIGCQLIMMPLIKILFKMTNIHFLKKSNEIPRFPFKELKKKENNETLYKKILESKDFFK